MTTDDLIARGRDAYSRHAWSDAHDALRTADQATPLEIDDLERLGLAAQLVGRDDESIDAWSRAHQQANRAGDIVRAARAAIRLGMMFLDHGELAQGGGWLSRAGSLLDDTGIDCVERGYLFVPEGIGLMGTGDPEAAFAAFERAAAIAERFGDVDLATLGRLGRGRALIEMADVSGGVTLLDEAMVAVTAGEVTPIVVGVVYCASIEAFHSIFDLRRAREWTDALAAWCDSQPDLVPFRGECLVYRAELMRFSGEWPEAIEEARRAQAWLSRPPPAPAVGEAYYQQAELHRLRGDATEAEVAYREASQAGRAPEPGLALLRLAQGQREAAFAIIRRAVDESTDALTRAGLLGPLVEIALDSGDLATAREAADALAGLEHVGSVPLFEATAARTQGAVLLAEGDVRGALAKLRRASAIWQELDAPYDLARTRVLTAMALQQLGDTDTAGMELDAARRVFDRLGARPDLVRLDEPAGKRASRPDGLSVREIEVLRLVAAGKTNRAIAAELVISERTVDRHVSNILTKLDVASRSAATAYAYEHDVLES